MYQVGQTTLLVGRFSDAAGNPVDPTAVTVTITKPDATTETHAATNATVGVWEYPYTPATAGRYQYVFTGTGANANTTSVDVFTAATATSSALISLDQAKKQLSKAGSADDQEILGFIQAATDTINKLCGWSVPTIFTETVEGRADASGRTTVILSRTPVLSVTSITNQLVGLPAVDLTQLVINPDAGTLILGNWFVFYGPSTVVYVAGRDTVPPILQTACVLLVQWLWRSRRGGATETPDQGGSELVQFRGVVIPQQVAALLQGSPYTAVSGIA